MPLSRRRFLSQAAAVTAGFTGLRTYAEDAASGSVVAQLSAQLGFGPLANDPQKVLDLPSGFSYRIFSKTGEKMDDGYLVPAKHDGMAAFPGPDGMTLLVRNHEVEGPVFRNGPFGWQNELMAKIDPAMAYDTGFGRTPALGGTTTLAYDTKQRKMVRHWLSLACTERNCAGGPTPWGSWITCEETVERASEQREKDHGYNFEVPASAEIGLTKPVALKAMGRFNHEAVAVDPETGIVYQTEDRQDGVVYRFIPDVPGRLEAGGKLQALAVKGLRPIDLRNWHEDAPKKLYNGGSGDGSFQIDTAKMLLMEQGKVLDVEWVDVDDVESPDDNLRYQAYDKGAARFARGEGMWHGHKSIYFATTTGGRNAKGQIWRYAPSRFEGTPDESRFPGRLELFIEPNDASILQHADNICIAPWGDLIVCEDGGPVNHVLGVTPEGEIYQIARNTMNKSEFAGSCFSPDGSTLFVNIQNPGLTIAITGPWAG
ncbi:MAG: PhoX family protein [Phycisphaeraceae bacterium]|nr:PhoX family protein [Phycisphaeraceae bacterium]